MKLRKRIVLTLGLALLVMIGRPIAAQKRAKPEETAKAANLPAVIWRDPGDVATLDLFYGPGGKEHAPDPHGKFTFLKEDLKQSSPKFDVEDEQGMHWRVKLGQEPQSETAATRLLWAAGYFASEDYYFAEVKVIGLPKLHRGGQFVSADGIVHRARFERRDKAIKKLGDWDWFDNPFVGTKELNGLRVMMALLNNWDAQTNNNAIYEVDGERRYLAKDVGASFGKTGNPFPSRRSKSVPKDYVRSSFIAKEDGDYVNFVMHSRPFFLAAVDAPNYRKRSRIEDVTKHIPRTDAKWLGQRLAQLSEEQIRDCFRAAGYTPEEIEMYTKEVRKRIAELAAL